MKSILASPRTFGRWLLAAAMAAGLCVAAFNYLSTGNGIDHTAGALLVIVSSVLLLGASLLFGLRWVGARWLAVILDILILLGLIGTAAAAYFLEADLLLVLMILGLCAWLVAVLASTPSVAKARVAGNGATR